MKKSKTVTIIGVPMDLGQSLRGVAMGPSSIRYAGITQMLKDLDVVFEDNGDILIAGPESGDYGDSKLKYINEVTAVCTSLAESVKQAMMQDHFPLVLGGDHSIAIGTIAGITSVKKKIGCIWYDAHGDLNTEQTSPSGNIHGMSLAVSLGVGSKALTSIFKEGNFLSPENTVIIGARDLDKGERALIKKLGITVYTMHDIDRLGMATIIEKTISIVSNGTEGVHLSLDLDGVDPKDAPGVGTPVVGGISYRESHLAMEMLYDSGVITSAEFVEVNPILDHRNQTAKVAVDLIGSLLGDKLL